MAEIEETGKALAALVEKSPLNTAARLKLVSELEKQGKSEEARQQLIAAVSIDPTQSVAQLKLADLLLREGDINGAVRCFGLAQAFTPRDSLRLKIALALPPLVASNNEIALHLARVRAGLGALSAQSLSISDPTVDGASLFYLAYYGINDRPYYEALAQFYRRVTPDLALSAPHCVDGKVPDVSGRKIRVGFVSRFLREHSIGKLNRRLITGMDREKFHVTVAVGPGGHDDLTKELLQSADLAIELPGDLGEARRRLALAKLDVLVFPEIGMDTWTYCLGFARLAPVQCVTWGHPVTTGIPNIDYFVSSKLLEDPDNPQRWYSEKLFQLETLPTSYPKPVAAGKLRTRADVGLEEGVNYYLIAQYLFKLHPDFDAYLEAILKKDPKARILVVHGRYPRWSLYLKQRWARKMGDIAERIEFVPPRPNAQFLDLMKLVDVILDIPTFNGGNTTFEALSVGTPVVTQPHSLMRGRVCGAILRQAKLDVCIADSLADYVDTAVRLVTDEAFGTSVRKTLEANVPGLFERDEAIREWERFFTESLAERKTAPGPNPPDLSEYRKS